MNIDFSLLGPGVIPLVVFSMVMFLATLSVRRLIQALFKNFSQTSSWRNFFLPTLPIALGAVFAAVMHKYPFLCDQPTWGTRAFYGAVAGGLSGFVYRLVKAQLGAKGGDTIPPPSGNA